MALSKENIVVGAATLVELGGTDLGGTKGGVIFGKEDTFFDKTGDQVKGNLDKVLVNRRVFVRTELLEGNAPNLHKALNLAAAQLSGSSVSITDSEAALAALKVTGPTTFGGTRTLILDAVRNISNFEMTWGKDVDIRLAFEFEAMWNPTNNRFGISGN